MNLTVDPRTLGFNYGPGWGNAPKPPVYQTAIQIAYVLTRQARVISDAAWKLEIAIRRVRLASSDEEKEMMVAQLEAALEQHMCLDVD
jgi:hypothetical protein